MKKKLLVLLVTLTAMAILIFSLALFVGAEGQTPTMSIDYNNLSLRDTVCLKYAVSLENAKGATLLIWETPQSEYIYGTQDAELESVGTQTINGKTYHIYDYTELSAKQMADEVYARAYVRVSGKDYYSNVKTYSILEYALTVQGKLGNEASDNAKLIRLTEQMLSYGAAAQEYMGYNTDRLANAEFGQVLLGNGTFENGEASGLFVVGTDIKITASATDGTGKIFSHWVDQNGNKYGTNATCTVTVREGANTYSPVYTEPKAVDYFYTDAMVTQLKSYIASNPGYFTAFVDGVAPFAFTNPDFISNGKVASLGLPVKKTTTADANGNYTLTIQVVGKDAAVGYKSPALRSYTILVNGTEYGLTNNMTTMKWIDLDLSDYNIVLAEDETLAFFMGGDTLYPAYTNNATVKNYISGAKAECMGFYMYVGQAKASSGNHALIFNVGMEHVDLAKDAYYYESTYTANEVNAIKTQMGSNASYFPAYSSGVAAFSPNGSNFITDGRITSIGLPVAKTKTADANGNYSLTVHVVGKTLADMQSAPLRTYTVLVNGTKYGLTDSMSTLTWIDIDLSDYNITLSKNETIALFSPSDTLIPAYTNKSAVTSVMPSEYVGFYMNVGKASASYNSTSALPLDICMERDNKAVDPYVTESLYPDALVNELKEQFSAAPSYFTAFSSGTYMMQAADFITDGTVKSIGMPVTTKAADANGNYTLSLSVFGKDWKTGLPAAARRSYTISVNGAQYGLTDNMDTITWIDLDVSAYDIVLAKDESLAFFAEGNTLIPYYTKNVTVKTLIDSYAENATGFLTGLGSSVGINVHALIFNVTMERNYTIGSATNQAILAQEAAEAQKLAALKQIYEGKTVSVIGDSISTFNGYSNNTAYNSTIGGNAVYYGPNSNISSVEQTYWMKVMNALGMELCVNNSWSAGRVFGKSAENYADSAVNRSVQLHNNEGVTPDVILFFMGINDINNNVPFGNLLTKLSDENTRAENLAIIDAWFQEVLARNATPVGGSTYTTFQEAYALSLYRMKTTYASAEIYCLNLMPCEKYFNNNGGTLDMMENYNYFYELMVDYFDLNLVDQYSAVYQNYYTYTPYYTNATDLLHPNAGGHTKMAERILNTMADKNGIQ